MATLVLDTSVAPSALVCGSCISISVVKTIVSREEYCAIVVMIHPPIQLSN